MYYEFECNHEHDLIQWLSKRPMIDAHLPEYCPECGAHAIRLYSLPQINMNDMVADGFKRTTEPPDDCKPDQFGDKLRDDLEHYKIVSTPTHTRRAGTIDRPNKKKNLYERED